MKKLQILITQYKETDDIVKPLLDSIELQQNVDLKNDVGVIIVNDGTDVKLSQDLLSKYTYEIEYYHNEHKGVSATRNACLDHATADYVMFCDADDMFFNMCGLWIIFQEIENGGFDSMTSIFIEESRMPDTKKPIYINRQMDSTFVHGKVHRRQYLIDKNIRWNEKLTIHEDSYFNILCQKLSQNVKYCQSPFYLWKWRDESVCRRDPKYILKTMPNMLASSSALVGQLLKRELVNDAKFYATSMIMDCYYNINCKQWLANENARFKKTLEKHFKKYYEKYKSLFESIDEGVKAQIINGVRNRFAQEGLVLESITFDEWLKHIKSL